MKSEKKKLTSGPALRLARKSAADLQNQQKTKTKKGPVLFAYVSKENFKHVHKFSKQNVYVISGYINKLLDMHREDLTKRKNLEQRK